jgi:hypothetical protein
MLDDVEKRLSSLSKVAEELNAASDSVTAALRSLEERLVKLKLGVEVLVEHPPDVPVEITSFGDADGETTNYFGNQYFLGYGKIAGSWRLLVQRFACAWPGRENEDCVEVGDDFTDMREPQERKPLLDSSRDVRLAATAQLELLLAEIEEAARERIESLKKITAEAEGDAPSQMASPANNDGSNAKRGVRARSFRR